MFYRYKRAKISDAYKSGDNSKDTIIRLTECTPGLEGYNAAVETYTSTQLMELSRGNVRAALLDNLAPKDNSKRAHRKNPNSTMSFLEMNRIMTASWKSPYHMHIIIISYANLNLIHISHEYLSLS